MTTRADQLIADELENNNSARMALRLASLRRRQAARSGRGETGEPLRAQIGRSSGVHTSRPREVFSFTCGASGRQTPMPGLFVSALLLLGVGAFSVLIVLKRAIWGG
jgi:hypothetical protein